MIQIKKRYEIDSRVKPLSKRQMDISRTEKRCVYAKNDPCWGYDSTLKKIKAACINKNCKYIKKCNPNYTKDDGRLWRTTAEDKWM